jgi:hypothetical protein
MFQRCHSGDCNEGVMDCMGHTFPLFYCAQSPLDGCLHRCHISLIVSLRFPHISLVFRSDPGLYEEYKATIRELLQIINPSAYRYAFITLSSRFSRFRHVFSRSALALDVAAHIQRYFRTFPAVSSAMVSVDGHRDVWSETVTNIATQQSRHSGVVSPSAEFTAATAGQLSTGLCAGCAAPGCFNQGSGRNDPNPDATCATYLGAGMTCASFDPNAGGGVSGMCDKACGYGACAAVAAPVPPQCDALRGDVCELNTCKRFVASGMSGRSCAEYCCEFGLGCVVKSHAIRRSS